MSLPAVRQCDVNRRATPANIFCTAHGTRSFGQAGAYNPRRTRFAAPASFSKVSHCRTAIKSNQAVAESSAPCTKTNFPGTSGRGAKRPFQMLAALGWPKTVSVVRKAIKGEQGKGG